MTKTGVRRAAVALVATVGLAGFGVGTAFSAPGPPVIGEGRLIHKPVRYETVISHMRMLPPSDAPDTLVVRCAGWTEDSIDTLDLVKFERDGDRLRAVYKCVTP